jgi:cellulose synthase/poly-beta-1,6-N-acetylglucosamine synthase-like glycosyltransferase
VIPEAAPCGRRVLTLRVAIVTSVVAVLAWVTMLVNGEGASFVVIAYWYLGAGVITACLFSFLIGRRYLKNTPAEGKVLCIIPAYNEEPAGLDKTVRALLKQTVAVDIVVIDDGSQCPVQPSVFHPRLRWMRQENTGKRGAQCTVLNQYERSEYDFILTVDSDSEPYPDACEQLLRAMRNPKIHAATGMIYIRNFDESWVSLAADLDIGTSCVMMRASRSMLGALETTSGALALYRSGLLYDHLAGYSVECGTGDDRWLALRALRRGQVVAVAEAIVETDMPTTLRGTYKQRLRWSRSWWWMMPYVLKFLGRKQLLSPLYGVTQLLVTPLMVGCILFGTLATVGDRYAENARVFALYFAAYVFVRYGLSALYLIGRPNVSFQKKLLLFLLGTPAAVFLNVILLVPTRYIALGKLFDNRWQTRELSAAQIARFQEASSTTTA